MQLEDWLDDLCVRFIINLPHEELGSVERICFQIEEAQWFYEDFIRPLDASLPSLPLRNFSLLIFQHCPLFAGFPEEFFVKAFSQFLAYKTRVPVRGAIMLNDAMDHVVLVKGWKKNANWSFPRGKINKDEKDLDCAVREVYEETGYDIRGSGLVLDQSEMKYISITIREQDVGLYVFRGVPMDTAFNPKTRKEISKVDWWKLSDLPTFKRNKHQEGNGENLAINANKFYMVAPFLHELRKWISFQRKRDAIEGRHIKPRQTHEEPVTGTEDEQDLIDLMVPAPAPAPAPAMPSDLPEVTVARPQPNEVSAHLKALLNINSPQANQPTQNNPATIPADRVKSDALLSLLRTGMNNGLDHGNGRLYTPQNQYAAHDSVPQSPHHHNQPPTLEPGALPPSFFRQAPEPTYQHRQAIPQPVAPYEMTAGPGSGRDGPQFPAAPPASSLPQLNPHARSLLDAFKSQTASAHVAQETSAANFHHQSNGRQVNTISSQNVSHTSRGDTKVQHQNNLLNLFRQPISQSGNISETFSVSRKQNGPAELSAQPPTAAPNPGATTQKYPWTGLFTQSKDSLPPVTMVMHKPPTPVKILQRPTRNDDAVDTKMKNAQLQEERAQGVDATPKVFQPQILRRPPQVQLQSNPSLQQLHTHSNTGPSAPTANSTISFDRRSSQSEVHKQALLSLFNKPSQAQNVADSPVSAATRSPGGIISPLGERDGSGQDIKAGISPPIRSRMGSASSLGGVLTPTSSRTTKPSDRAFLLQYLGVAKGSS